MNEDPISEYRHRLLSENDTDDLTADMRRELAKAREALHAAMKYLDYFHRSNAALHCSENVMHSPLYAKLESAHFGIDHALRRTEPGV